MFNRQELVTGLVAGLLAFGGVVAYRTWTRPGVYRYSGTSGTATGAATGVAPAAPVPAEPAPVGAAPSTPVNAPPPVNTAPQNWALHQDPQGFELQLPPGWRVESKERSVRAVSGDGRSFALVQAVFGPGGDAAAVIQRQGWPDREVFPGARVEGVRAGGRQATGVLSFSGPGGASRASVLCALLGNAGMMFATAAPVERFPQEQADMVRILKSFRFIRPQQPPGQPPAPPAVSFETFRDPTEAAFTIQVPQGWRVQGGTLRRSAVDLKHSVTAASPDGISILWNDPNIPTFTVPTETLGFTGFREGSWYSPGYGSRMMVRRYLPGLVFASEYVGQFARAQGVSNLQLVDRRERPDLTQMMNRQNAQGSAAGFGRQSTVGEVAFRGSRNGQPVAGYCGAATTATGGMGMAIWTVDGLGCWVAPPGREGLAHSVISQMTATFQYNPQWFQAQQGTTGAVSQVVTNTSNYVSQLQSQSYWSQQASQARTSQNYSDYIRGVQRVQDPATGQQYEAVAGSNYYWLPRGGDRPFGTNTADVPQHIDVTPLEQVR